MGNFSAGASQLEKASAGHLDNGVDKGGLDEEDDFSGYGRSSSNAGPDADGVGSGHHYDGHHDGDHVRHAVARHPEEWWPRHPSAGGRAASRVGYSDLRHSAAQVATN